MEQELLAIKKLNAAYVAALEYDRCPDSDEASDIHEDFETGVTLEELKLALEENQGRRPDEIAQEMSDLIKLLSDS